MVRGIGVILLMTGIAAVIYGLHAASHVRASAPFAAKPDNQLMWFYLGGIAGIVLGATMVLLPTRKS